MKALSIIILSLVTLLNAYGVELQILHTNDLHGFIENTVFDKNKGGYAAIKAMSDDLKARAIENNVSTLRLDAGDFMEGSLFYLSKNGRVTLDIMNKMDFDAVVIGNHDYLMGIPYLETLLEEIPLNFAFLGANFLINKKYKNINQKISPYKIFKFEDIKVAVLGLTTDEVLYSWRLEDNGSIEDPVKKADKWSKFLKEEKKVDFVIALTHVGDKVDKEIAKNTEHIDLIVGGHSHVTLFLPQKVENQISRWVPIVQTGAHGNFLGQLILDLKKNEPLKIKKYKLLPVSNTAKTDKGLNDFVKNAKSALNDQFGINWLNEVIGTTEVELFQSEMRATIWGKFISDALKDSVDVDVSFTSSAFRGARLPLGEVKRSDLFNAHPRIFDFDRPKGWAIYKTHIRGIFLKTLIKTLLKANHGFNISGLTFKYKKDQSPIEESQITDIKINGEPIKSFTDYTLALPEGIIRGGFGISSMINWIFTKVEVQSISIWEALEIHMKKVKLITVDYFVENNLSSRGDFMFIPKTNKL